jgi:hypothetical protein
MFVLPAAFCGYNGLAIRPAAPLAYRMAAELLRCEFRGRRVASRVVKKIESESHLEQSRGYCWFSARAITV